MPFQKMADDTLASLSTLSTKPTPRGQNRNKSAFVAFSGPCISRPKRPTKLIFTNPIASKAGTSQITFKHIFNFQMGRVTFESKQFV